MKRSKQRTKLVKTRLRRIERHMGTCLLLAVVCFPLAIVCDNESLKILLISVPVFAFPRFCYLIYKFAPEARLMWDVGQVEKRRIAAGQCDESWWAMSAELRTKILLFEFKYVSKGETIEQFEKEDLPIWIENYVIIKYKLVQNLHLILEEPKKAKIPYVQLACIKGDLEDAAIHILNPNVEYLVVRKLSAPAKMMTMDTVRKCTAPSLDYQEFINVFEALSDYGEIRDLTPAELLEGCGAEAWGEVIDEKYNYPAGYGAVKLQCKMDIVCDNLRKRGLLKTPA